MKGLLTDNDKRFAWLPFVTVLLGAILSTSCDEFVFVGPPRTEITAELVFSDDASAISVMRGTYSSMMAVQSFTNGELEWYTGLSSDELVDYSGRQGSLQFYLPQLTSINGTINGSFWREAYKYISNANAVLEGLSASKKITGDVRAQLEGEAKFVRAFCHFYLVNLFGDVPYVMTTDYRRVSRLARESVSEVYGKIVADLIDARNLLADDHSYSRGNRAVPNKYAATALLARVYLYTADWEKAVYAADEVIGNTLDFQLEQLQNVFLDNSREVIWQLQPVTSTKSTAQARLFILSKEPTEVALRPEVVAAFEPGDERLNNWVGEFVDDAETYYYPFKYKIYTSSTIIESSVVIRLAEIYLIRAEARAHLMDLPGAIDDVDMIRDRAGLSLINDVSPSIDQADLLQVILNERRFEFLAEWGHRWFDLKRTGVADEVLGETKLDWQSTDALYPIPNSEILLNPFLVQNPGY